MSRTFFENVFSKQKDVVKDGGRFVPADSNFPSLVTLFDNVRDRATDYIDTATKGFMPKKSIPWVHFDFVDNTLLNAMAFRSKGHYFIGVNMGTPLLICDLFYRMLACSEVLTHVGNPEAEIIKPRSYPTLYHDADFIEQVVTAEGIQHVFTMPIDPVRRQYADLLSMMALDFLIAHEFAHILDAHLLLCEQATGSLTIFETRWSASEGETPVFQQALEYDADTFAISEGFHKLCFHCDDPRRSPVDWQPFFQDPIAALYTWYFAVYTLFRLMGAGMYEVVKFSSSSHLPPRMRQLLLPDHVRGNIIQHKPEYIKRFDGTKCRLNSRSFTGMPICATLDVERAVAILTTAKLDFTGFEEASSAEGTAHLYSIYQEWESIKPKAMELTKLMEDEH